MNLTKIKGSITVEAIVMLGLIATLTPILYKHVSERRQDIENINEANTLLLLKNATAEYIEANKETLTTGTLTPADIGIDISGYQIGIRKDSSGNIDAMITGTGGGNDLKAGKIAALLGISAGIYSAQNTATAWGINGVWAEDISNYGFSSLPTGIPVITIAYDKEDASGLNEEQLKDFIENTAFNKLSADEICLKGNCISEWADTTYEPIPTIINCNGGDPNACKKGFQKGINTSCSAIAETYQANEASAQTGFYTLTTSESSFLYNQPCVFTNGEVATNGEVHEQCNNTDTSNAACRYGWNNDLNRSCEQIIEKNDSATSGWYNITSSNTASSQPCYFVGTNVATKSQTVDQCNSVTTSSAMNTNIACRFGYVRGYNTSCTAITDTPPAYTPRKGQMNSITTATGGSQESCTRTCAVIGTVSGGECRDVSGWGWVRSTGAKNYWNAQTFCSNLGMEIKSWAQAQEVGVFKNGLNPFDSPHYLCWITDIWTYTNEGMLMYLDGRALMINDRNNSYKFVDNQTFYHYALCGPR